MGALRRGGAGEAARGASNFEAFRPSRSEGLFILEGPGGTGSLNPPAREIFGPVGDGIILGQPLDLEQWGQWPLGARAVAEAVAPVVAAVRRGEALRDVEVELTSQGRRVLSFSATPLWDSSGQLAGGGLAVLR